VGAKEKEAEGQTKLLEKLEIFDFDPLTLEKSLLCSHPFYGYTIYQI